MARTTKIPIKSPKKTKTKLTPDQQEAQDRDRMRGIIDTYGGFCYKKEPIEDTERRMREHANKITQAMIKDYGSKYNIEERIENAEHRPPFALSWKITKL